MRGGEPGIAGADDDDIGLNLARQRRKGTQGLGCARPSEVADANGVQTCAMAARTRSVQCPTAASAKAFIVAK